MDHDDNDFQGRNLQLAGEGNSNFSPVIRPYALHKFDFDDSLQGHLRFDTLVENEVFLGIPSQEDNQWIEDFSRGNSGIEFSSSAAESCSISRRNNVWSEATSSESVEMLLKSVGQGEMIVPGETIIEESDGCDELGSLTNQTDPDLKQLDKIEDVVVLDQREIDHLDPIVVGEENPVTDGKLDGLDLKEVDNSVKDSLNDKEVPNPVVDIPCENTHDLPEECKGKGVEEQNIKSREANCSDKISSGVADEICDYNTVESVKNHENENTIGKLKETSSLQVKVDSDLQIPEGSNKDLFLEGSSLDFTKETNITEQFEANANEESPAVFEETNVENENFHESDTQMDDKPSYKEGDENVSEASSQKIEGGDNDPTVQNDPNAVQIKLGVVDGSMQICDENVLSEQGDVHKGGEVVVLPPENGNSQLPTESLEREALPISENMDKEDTVKAHGGELDASNENKPAVTVENVVKVLDHSEEQKSDASRTGMNYEDKQEDMEMGVPSSTRLSALNELDSVSSVEKSASVDFAIHIVNETSCIVSNESELATNKVGQEGSDKMEVDQNRDSTDIMGDKAAESGEVDETVNVAASLEVPGDLLSQSEIVDALPIPNKSDDMNKPVESSVKLSPDVDHEANQTVESGSHPVGADTGIDPVPSSVDGGNPADSYRANCGSPTVISCIEVSHSESDKHEKVDSGSLSQENDEKVQSVSKENDSSKVEKSFTFEVNPLVVLSEGETGKGWKSFPSVQICKITTMEGSPSTSDGGQFNFMIPQEIPRSNPQPIEVGAARKATPERKPRRSSAKSAGKEAGKKGTPHMKEKTPAKELDNKSLGPSSPLGTVHIERSGAKESGVSSAPGSNLPDLNTSVSPASLFQQPFTDVQQVQLRAQIFVYGSLIQGAAPDETCMVSAFGPSDGGRSVWESKWRTYLERIHVQKSTANTTESPAQSRSGTSGRTTDQVTKHASSSSHQSKVLSSPVGRPTTKSTPPGTPIVGTTPVVGGTPQSVVNPPMIPLSSPLWNVPTPSCERNPLLDYHQSLSPLNPYQPPPPVRNFVAPPNPSWLSQASFPNPWIASPQTSSYDVSGRFSRFPITESVKLNPVKESSAPISPIPLPHSVGPSVMTSSSTEPKSRKRKKVPVTEDLSPIISLSPQIQTETKKIAVTEDLGRISLIPLTKQESVSTPVVNAHFSTSVSVLSPTSSTDLTKKGDHSGEKKGSTEGGNFGEVEVAKKLAEEAASFAASAVTNCEEVWSRLDKQKNSGLVSDIEVMLAGAAVAIAAAAEVAKAAAAAAKIASNAAVQAKLMVEESLASGSSSRTLNSTPATILKGAEGSKSSSSIIFAAKEAARRRLEAASAASKHAENLDAIVKAAELASEAVSQAGKIVAMGDPLTLNELLAFGPEGYRNQFRMNNNVENVGHTSAERPDEGRSDKKMPTVSHGEMQKESSRDLEESHLVTSEKMDLRGTTGRRVSESGKPIEVVPEPEFGSISTSDIGQDEFDKEDDSSSGSIIKQGCLVEVLKDGANGKIGWFSARVLRLKDEKAFVGYTELRSDKEQLQEWVPLGEKGDKAPKIRIAHPLTTMHHSEGTRKRRRAALTDFAWSIGDKVDAWLEDCWCEGVVTEKNQKDETTLTVLFPAQGEKSVKAWDLRPILVYKDGEWTEWSSSRVADRTSQGDTPKEKRMKLGSSADEKGKEKGWKNNNQVVEAEKHGESRSLLPLSMSEKTFNVGKNTTRVDNKNLDAVKPTRFGFQSSSGVNIGVPKPGKKRKFMAVSEHYVSSESSNNKSKTLANNSVKFTSYLMKQGGEIKSKAPRSSGKPPIVSGRTLPQKVNHPLAEHRSVKNSMSISNEESESGQQKPTEFESNTDVSGGMVFSSKPLPQGKARSSSSERKMTNKGGKSVSGKSATRAVEVKERSVDVVEPQRRSNRRIQPTSRLLEGLQSSLIISKIPSASHDKSHRAQNRGTSKGN